MTGESAPDPREVDLSLDAEDLAALDSARTMTPLTLHMVAAAMVRKHRAIATEQAERGHVH